jgi:hypothetical protein
MPSEDLILFSLSFFQSFIAVSSNRIELVRLEYEIFGFFFRFYASAL